MKKIFCILLCGVLIFSLSSCKENENQTLNSSSDTSSKASSIIESSETITSVVSSEEVSSAEPSSEPEVSKISSVTESKKESSKPVTSKKESSKIPSSKVTPSTSKPAASKPVTSKPATSTAPQPSNTTVSKFTVTDPNNLRGLSTTKNGFSFGIAENGKPHSQSIANQKNFDEFKGVDALALDTKTTEKVMYLTFDNGYEYENLTANILDTLKAKGVKAAFFITLSYAKSNKALVQRMINEGHIVGNHSATHPSFPSLTRTEMAEDIAKLNDYLIQNFSYTSPYFRFPAGEYSESALELVSSIGFKSVFWSSAYSDWNTSTQKGAEYAYQTVTSRFHPGSVILLHAVSRDNAEALGRIIDTATSNGYTFKTLDDYFKR